MKPPPDIEAKGLKAYEQARAFERLRPARLPVSYSISALLPLAMALFAWEKGHSIATGISVAGAGVIACLCLSQWKNLKRRYAENLALLAALEKTYGDDLPWVQVEKHFAALEELQREVEEEQMRHR